MMNPRSLIAASAGPLHVVCVLALLFTWLSPTGGQEIGTEIGTDICTCAPNTYEFTLDFSLFCPPVNITIGDAVAATTCMVSPFGDPSVTDLIPVAVQSIDILELNRNLQVMMQENIAGNFSDGDTFQYTSYAALPGEIVNEEDLPRAIQINIIGVNQFGEPIINVYLITFTNSCGSYPVLFEGQSAGWTRFSDLGPPSREFCPLVPSDSPTMIPATPEPSPSPSPEPSDMPTGTPITDPTPPPTTLPTGLPPPPTTLPTVLPMSMSFSMSMDLRLGDLFDAMHSIEDISQEFGRESVIMDKVGIRGSRFPGSRPRTVGSVRKLRTKGSADIPDSSGDAPSNRNVECDDYPCAGATMPEDAFKNVEVEGKSSKSSKVSKSAKSEKNEKKDKAETKDAYKMMKGQVNGNER